MRYPHHPGVGRRITQRLTEMGLTKAEFIRVRHYDPRSFYPWVNDERTPAGDNLTKLAADLGVSAAWLLFGVEVVSPTKTRTRRALACLVGAIMATAAGMVPAEGGTLPVAEKVSYSDKLSRGIMSRRAWKWLQSLIFSLQGFPRLDCVIGTT